jgi:hypothetical protein
MEQKMLRTLRRLVEARLEHDVRAPIDLAT